VSRSPFSNRAFIVGAAILLGSAAALNGAVAMLKLHLRKKPIEVDQKVHSLPTETKSWVRVGEDRVESAEMVEELGTTNYLNRRYRRVDSDTAGKPIDLELHLAYYTGMVDTVPHVPDRCLVGAGWSIAGGPYFPQVPLDLTQWSVDRDATTEFGSESSPIYRGRLWSGLNVRMPKGIESLKINTSEYSFPGQDAKLTAGYFFIANGGVSSTPEGVRLLAFDLRSDYAFFLKVQITSMSATTASELGVIAGEFLQDMLPEIMQCVPDWIEVQRGNFPEDNPRRKGRSAAGDDAKASAAARNNN
jgi:hypothetical protein